MISAQEGGEDKPCNCISHEFFRSASRDAGKVAIVHAQGGLQLCKELQAAQGRGEIPDGDEEKRLIDSFRELPSPPVYRGDLCFTYGDILLAVESLSRRVRRVLDGGDDPDLVRPRGYVYPKRVSGIQNSEPSVNFRRMPQIVGVHAFPSIEYIVAVLSILRCGEAFLPLDPSWPRERLASVAARSKAVLIITCTTASNNDGCILNNETQWTEECEFSTLCFSIGKDTAEVATSDLDWPCETKRRRLYCYLMYTSGSTGKPKGVCGSETGLINRFLWMQQYFPAVKGDILLFKTPISFIDHIQEFLFAVLSCKPLIIPSFYELKADPFRLIDILKVYHISRLVIVPSLARATLFSSGRSHWMHVQKTLRLLMLSGEILSISLWEVLHQILPETVILNLYGSTEVSGDCTYFDCSCLPKILESEKLNSVPIGVPVPNCNVTLLQPGMSDEGEICVSGSCLFVGYFDDLSHNVPYEDIHSLPFKTGDFAKCLQSGNLIFVGRKDRMVKVNGQRIALEEIEHALREHPAVTDAAVVTKNPREPASHIFLKAYVVLVEHERAETSVKPFSLLNKGGGEKFLMISIRNWLTRKLPPVMVPSYFSFVKSLPMCSTGKVDYSILESSLPFPKGTMMKFDEKQCFRDFLQIIKKVMETGNVTSMRSVV